MCVHTNSSNGVDWSPVTKYMEQMWYYYTNHLIIWNTWVARSVWWSICQDPASYLYFLFFIIYKWIKEPTGGSSSRVRGSEWLEWEAWVRLVWKETYCYKFFFLISELYFKCQRWTALHSFIYSRKQILRVSSTSSGGRMSNYMRDGKHSCIL